jgi:hypothetical protein
MSVKRDNAFKLSHENDDYKLYTHNKHHYTGTTRFYWIEGSDTGVIKCMHNIFNEDGFALPKFVRIQNNDDGTVVYKGDRLINRG